MKWNEMSILTTREAVEPISHILHEGGASGVVIEDREDLLKERENVFGEIYQLDASEYPENGVRVKAYLAVTPDFDDVVATIKRDIANLTAYDIDIAPNIITMSEVREEEWATAWKKYYHPIQVSERITIVPSWEEYTPEREDECIIELDPGMAFGTGTHPTTTMCVQALEKYLQTDDTVIDVGTGTGVLAIAAAKLGASHVKAYDLDHVAVESATTNVALNGVADRITVGQNNLLNGIEGPVDCVVANLLADIILLFVDDVRKVLKKDGYFISSGIILAKKDDILAELTKYGFEVEEVLQVEDWIAIVAKNTRGA